MRTLWLAVQSLIYGAAASSCCCPAAKSLKFSSFPTLRSEPQTPYTVVYWVVYADCSGDLFLPNKPEAHTRNREFMDWQKPVTVNVVTLLGHVLKRFVVSLVNKVGDDGGCMTALVSICKVCEYIRHEIMT